MRGRIQKALSGFYYVNTGDAVLQCRARGKFRKDKISPLVGDWVEITDLGGGQGVVDKIEERRNAFDRPAVANIDQLVIIASEAIPQTAPYLIDRISAIAALKNCEVLVCLNKCDLDPADELFEIYSASAIPVLRISAETGLGMEELKERVAGKLSAFTGNSGVGKSSILNLLDPDFGIAVGEVSQALGRGRHTTRHVEMFHLKECDGYIIDTPGFASFESTELNMELKERLEETFPEFKPYLGECRFVGCNHVKEKGCRVLEAKKEGKIHPVRHASYVRLWEKLKPLQDWQQKNK
ncbi:MAG: ribosome small subunit-dependent GTPase A [Oscillospiraceae bacterium]|nr:ribosome small subunit-dependent GTPase A [Oscillospiraceae bacterium]